jgi:hypothetical protein
MFLIFKTVSEPQLGLVKRVGQYIDYIVGWLDDSVKDLVPIKHLNPTVIDDEDVALAWKFAGNFSGYVSVRVNTLINDQLDIVSSDEPSSVKKKYYLTEKDLENGAKFMKIVLRKMLDEVYDKRLEHLNLGVSTLEFLSWNTQFAEAKQHLETNETNLPMLQSLAEQRNISLTEMANKVVDAKNRFDNQVSILLSKKQLIEKEIRECKDMRDLNVLIHNRFGYNMPVKQQLELGIEESSKYDL